MPPGQDQYVSLPDGSYVHVPGDATPQQLDQLRTKLSSQYSGTPITDSSTIGAAQKPSLLDQVKAPFQETSAPVWNATIGGIHHIPLIGKYLPDLSANEHPAPGTAVRNMEDLTQQGRAEHPFQAKIGDLLKSAGQFTRTIAPEVALLGAPNASSSISDVAGEIPQMAARTFRNPEGEIAVTPSAILDRVIPQRAEVAGRQTAEELQTRMEEAEAARQKELVGQERLREQEARSITNRGKQQQALDEENRIPIKARQEMYEDLGNRRIARGEEQSRIDAANESRLKLMEDARQKELADQERLREQYARSINSRKEPQSEITPFSGTGVTSTAGIPARGVPRVAQPVSGIGGEIPSVTSSNPSLDISIGTPQVTGAAQKPFEPLVYSSPEEANQIDFRNANLKRQASSAGTFHAAQGGADKKLNLQQRIARKYGGTP